SDTSFSLQAEDGIRDDLVTGVQTCALPIYQMFLTRPASERLSNGGSIDLGLGAMLPITSFIRSFCAAAVVRRMTAETKHLEITLDRKSVVKGKRVGRGGRRYSNRRRTMQRG